MTKSLRADVFVTGDYVLDHHIYRGYRHHYNDRQNPGVREIEELGGAALVHYLLSELGGGIVSHLGVAVNKNRKPVLRDGKRVPPALMNYAVWKPTVPDGGKTPGEAVWLSGDAMGFGGAEPPAEAYSWPAADKMPDEPVVTVFFDGGMGFRNSPEYWPCDDVLKGARWIVLKTAHPVTGGAIRDHLAGSKFREKLVVVTSAAQLRKSAAQISAGLSWDATVESVLESLAPGGGLEKLSMCRHLLVVFGGEGGVWVDFDRKNQKTRSFLVYDADAVEGDNKKPGRGAAYGVLSCMAASAAWRLARGGEGPDFQSALEGGLSAIRDLHSNGHGPAAVEGKGYPASRLAATIKEGACGYSRTVIPAPGELYMPLGDATPAQDQAGRSWSIVQEGLQQQGKNFREPAWGLAELIVKNGPIALGSLPHLSIGKLISADRREIESLRVLRRLILEYKERPAAACRRPLSIGVFGPPGSGKSFAVGELTRTLVGKDGWLEFNLSQFKPGTEDLIGAFHQVRDCVLRNQIPVAFFDEFDSRNYGWLQYLLAPMQDGAFQEGQITHPIGKCIFIFAGGTSETFDSFGPSQSNTEAYAGFQLAKGPDFKSRLNGFLDVFGPNRREVISVDENSRECMRTPDPCDIFYPVRRALMIRSAFGCRPEDKLKIDNGLLHVLLRVPRYIHGTRSLVSIVEPLKKAYPGVVYRSLLPPRQQLTLHVDADEFIRECRKVSPEQPIGEPDPETMEIMADAVHETWRRLGKEDGWLGREDDVEFAALSSFLQESNRAAAKRMASVLALIGLELEPGENSPDELDSLRLKLEYNLELLSEAEHKGWMEWHLNKGWKLGAEKNREKKTHPCLKPYINLPDGERNKDRNSIRHYPDFARTAGMKIVTVKEGVSDFRNSGKIKK